MAVLDRAGLLAIKRETRDVEVDGNIVRLQALTTKRLIDCSQFYLDSVKAEEAWEADQKLAMGKRKNLPEAKAKDLAIIQILFSIVDETGSYSMEPSDYDALREVMAYTDLERIYRVFAELNASKVSNQVISEKKDD